MRALKRNFLKSELLAGVSIAILAMPAQAQQTAAEVPLQEEAPSVEDEIVVTGLRSSLENALQIRRTSDVILDGISSDDINSTPDLNLGEALQRIPGVQIDRSGERRNATVSVRGLPGSFAKTTLLGQNVATPTRGEGNGSPFGVFDAAIFNGADIVKSFTANLPAGGLSANIDLRLTPALERRAGVVVRAGMQYEESSRDFNPDFFALINHKFGDRFGVYGNVAYSKQTYRRDEVSINAYNSFSAARAAQYGIDANAADGTPQILLYPGQVRIQSRQEKGDRLSASGGFELEPINDLHLRVDGIYTRRKLDQSRLDVLRLQFGDVGSNIKSGDTTGQVVLGTNSDGTANIINAGTGRLGDNFVGNVFVAPEVTSINPQYFPDNRILTGNDTSWAIYPQIAYITDDWNVRVIGTYSKATGAGTELLLGARVDSVNNTAASRVNQNQLTNGITLNVNSGAGNFDNFSFNTTLPATLFDLEGRTYNIGAGNLATATTDSLPGRQRNVLTVIGSPNGVERTLKSIAGDVERKFEFGPFTAVQVGARYDREEGDIYQLQNSLIGGQLGPVDIVRQPELCGGEA